MLDLDKEELYDGKTFDEYFNVHWSHCIDEVKKDKFLSDKSFYSCDYSFLDFCILVYRICLVFIVILVCFCFIGFI